jgi:two-component system, OmpR family, sensor histidine kinase KdpD
MPQAAKDSREDTAPRREGLFFGRAAASTLSHATVRLDWRALGLAIAAVTGAVGIGLLLWRWIGLENVSLIFLTIIVAIAAGFGLWPSLFATVLSSLCYNFFFTAPYYTLTIDEPANVVAVVVFTIVAVIVSNVAARARVQAVAATGRARTTELLYAFSRKLAGTGTLDDVLWATAHQTALMLNVRVVLLLAENGTIAVKAGYPPEDQLDEADLAAAHWAWQHDVPAGHGTSIRGRSEAFVPADADRPWRHRGGRDRQ